MKANGFTYEVIFVNDGSKDKSWDVIEDLHRKDAEHVHAIKFRRNYGKSPALYCGLRQRRVMLLLQWTPIYKTLLMRYQSFTG